ncbi:L,D-transpeptidase family protein [Maledivibacter halophilus]|uniref:Uncharacterized protein conserved in bacteria n=1 Tax=Maledivibacter halophilus TaxID=36842 RepID=A0A1T5IUZ9_9FIRM|nr:L,D-transpeptidase family protein [Maledivibacter halophilus]SKC43029.1 Uncharacterized protein conserved in bacteria [Maledivibacter halophilus]
MVRKHKNIILICIIIFCFFNIYSITFFVSKIEDAALVFSQQESSNTNMIFINRLVKDGKVVKLLREEEELGEIIIDDNLSSDRKEKISFFRTLGLYNIGADVKELNISLYYLGYGTNKNSRIFDKKTKEAVRAFQRDYKLKVDGFAGIHTIGALNQTLKSKKITIPNCEPNVQKVLSNNYWIVINKDANILKLYRGQKLVKKYPVATGKEKNYTPEGKFKIIRKNIDPYWGGGRDKDPIKGGVPQNPLGTRWLGLDFGGGTLYGIHGTNNPRSIGKHVSNGCIRMHNRDVEELFSIVKRNTMVYIGTDKKLNQYIY